MFCFLQKLPVKGWKINLSYNTTTLCNQNFSTCHDIFVTKIFLPDFGGWDTNIMTLSNQLASKQITNLQNTIA